MSSTPALLSVGMRVVHYGYSFIWLPNKRPCMVTDFRSPPPTPPYDDHPRCVLILKVDGDIPYLDYDTYTQSACMTPEEMWELTSVYCTKDDLTITHPWFVGGVAAPATRVVIE